IMKEVKDECEDHGISSDEEASDMNTQQQFVFNGSETGQMSGIRDSVVMTPAAVSTPGARLMVTDEDYYRMLQNHKRKRMKREVFPELDIEGITLEDIISRTNLTARRASKTVVKRKYKVKEKREQKKKFKKKRTVPNVVPKPLPPAPPPASPPVIQRPNEVEPMIEQGTIADVKSYKVMESSCPCFFSLLRDIFLDLPDATAELDQLERMVGEWQQSSSCAASAWSTKERNWIDQIPSALKFLAGSGKDVSNCPPYIPMVIFKQKVHQWKWIGTFRDTDTDLVPLFEHWLDTKDNVVSNTQTSAVGVIPRTEYVVAPSTVVEKTEYQVQERQRYENPHKPFIYKMHGFESIVAPVKGVFTKESNLNKAREHSLLVSKRPPYVTILTLVRDAAARLPNGEGTRAEVCLLLKDSQYINPTATDGQIHTVVSGALDRLHYEKDPCVKYDNARKVWIYLHKTRTAEEFEKLHEASAAAARAKKQQNQKQKLLKQQQKAKEAAIGIPDISLPSTVSDETEGPKMNLPVLNIGFPDATKTKKPAKPKRPPSANPKKQDKTKAKPQNESMEMTTHDLTTIVQPPLPPMPMMDAVSPVQPFRAVTPQQPMCMDQIDSQDRNLLHNRQPGSNFQRTSRLNSPYVPVDQPGLERISSGYGVDMDQSGGGDVDNGSDISSSGDGDSDSETESSGVDDVISQRISISQHQDPSLQYGEQRMPFNSVMSLFQNNPDPHHG
ncbi:nuclear factor related to kappa-B-binding isoform X2, partial [Paramuricea clavata]